FSTGALQQIINDVCSETAPSFSVDFTDPEAVALGKLQVMGGACGELGQAPMVSAVGLESSVANVGSRIPGIARTDYERHFNLTVDAEGKPNAMDFANGTGKSGDLFINLLNFTNTRDKIRQNSVDLLNLLQRSEEHTSELQSRENLVCRLLLEKKKPRVTYMRVSQ